VGILAWPELDPLTLLFSIALLSFSVAGVILGTSRAISGARFGLVDWSKAMVSAGLSVLLYSFRGHGPMWLTFVVANVCVLGVPVYSYFAYSRFYSVRPRNDVVAALCVTGLSGIVAVNWFEAPYSVAVMTICASIAALFGMSVWLAIRHEGRKASLPTILSATSIGLLCVAYGMRAILAASMSSGPPVGRTASVVFLLVACSLYVGVASLSFLFMAQERYRQEALESARRDGLTGLLTRTAFFESAGELDRAGAPYGMVVIDVDHFKRVNDTRGHACGDVVLAHVGRLIQRSVRTADLAGRYGGEEFCVILRGCAEEETRRFAERLVEDAAQQVVRLSDTAETLRLTVSAGYATRLTNKAGQELSAEQVFKRADAALYEAKRAGRNRAQGAASAQPDRGSSLSQQAET
jgi:diguanylate cyclase (GGDEF)-like protein